MGEAIQKVKRNGQITLPKAFREKVGLKDGDMVETRLTEDGSFILRVIDGWVPQYREVQTA
jgi:AbrB family looped-hinge helix DNA binding protein